MAGKRSDLKYKFVRGLQRLEIYQRSKHWLKSAAECTSRAIVSLELSILPVKSLKQAEQLEGIGLEIKKKLEKIKEDTVINEDPPVRGKFISSAGAILVALLEATELAYAEGHSKESSVLIPEEVVKAKVTQMCEEQFVDEEDSNTCLCPAWWRMEVLIKRDLVKRRSLNKKPVYVLQDLGMEKAVVLRERSGRIPIADASVLPWTTPLPCNDDVLYTNYDGSDGVLLLVDTSEMGGDRVGLGDLCRKIEDMNIMYKTKKLTVGDYSWVWNCEGQERILPFLVERKRADDVARTLKDGRFWTQVTKMVEWKNQFVARGLQCQLQYILEGEPEQYMVRCMDGCQGVGMCGNPTVVQVKRAIQDLRYHPDLVVQHTENIEDTVVMLASITAELEQRVKKGEFDEMVVKELSSQSRDFNKEFYVVGSDDEVTVVSSSSRSNSPDCLDGKNGDIKEKTQQSETVINLGSETSQNSSSTVSKNKKTIPFEDLPLEPLVQYHFSSGIKASPNRRTTPSKYHGAGAYKPKINYMDDSVLDKCSSPVSRSKLNIDQDIQKSLNTDRHHGKDALFSKSVSFKHKLNDTQKINHEDTKKYCPKFKKFKMASVSTSYENEHCKKSDDKQILVTNSSLEISNSKQAGKRLLPLVSVDSAISSDEEYRDESVQFFLGKEKKHSTKDRENKAKFDKFDSALSESDSDSLPDLNFNDVSQGVFNSRYETLKNSKAETSPPAVNSFHSDQIKTVKNILPQIPNSLIQSALERYGWNVDLTVTELLDTGLNF